MSSTNLISVITPVYNAGEFLKAAWYSLRSQSHSNWEWLVIDDGSSDGCTSFLNDLGDDRVRLFKQGNQGVSAARNVGLNHMKGSFFCFLDADDLLPIESLISRLRVLEDKGVHFADGATERFVDDPEKTWSRWIPSYRGEPTQRLLAIDDTCFFGNTWLIRREPNIEYSFNLGMTHSEDLLFYLSICQGKKLDFTEQTVLLYRKVEGSAMTDLAGLEKGYMQLVSELSELGYSADQRKITRAKARSIMWKSWLKAGKPLRALQSQMGRWE